MCSSPKGFRKSDQWFSRVKETRLFYFSHHPIKISVCLITCILYWRYMLKSFSQQDVTEKILSKPQWHDNAKIYSARALCYAGGGGYYFSTAGSNHLCALHEGKVMGGIFIVHLLLYVRPCTRYFTHLIQFSKHSLRYKYIHPILNTRKLTRFQKVTKITQCHATH